MASNIKLLASKIPNFSLKGVAYLAAANFLARAIILVRNYIVTYFHSEMILIYGATLDTRILLFFQAIYMIPMFALGLLVFFGIERESFNLVLYPTLMLLFLVLIRYGAESALLVIHWEDHNLNQTPELVFTLLQDVIFIALLLFYIYACLAFTPIKPTPLELLEGGSTPLVSPTPVPTHDGNLLSVASTSQQQQPSPSSSSGQLPQNHLLAPPAADPDSQGFNYGLRRNIDQIPKDSSDKAMLDEIERQRQRNSLLLKEKESGGGGVVIETDLDAVHAETTTTTTAVVEEEPVAAVVRFPFRKRATVSPKEPEKPPEHESDIWGNMNGNSEVPSASASANTESFKTTSV